MIVLTCVSLFAGLMVQRWGRVL